MAADVVGLAPGRQRYAMFTSPTGGILDDLMVANFKTHLFLVVNASRKEQDEAHLRAALGHVCEIEVLRDRALLALGRGESLASISRRLEVTPWWVAHIRDRLVVEGERGHRPMGGYRVSRIAHLRETIGGWLQRDPGLTLQAMADRLFSEHQISLKVPALWHQLNRWGLSLKKNPARQRARTSGRAAGAH